LLRAYGSSPFACIASSSIAAASALTSHPRPLQAHFHRPFRIALFILFFSRDFASQIGGFCRMVCPALSSTCVASSKSSFETSR
jgi:hypothetical protein